MEARVALSFLIEPLDDEPQLLSFVPVLGEIPLTRLIEDFEQERNLKPSGGYAGLVPKNYLFGPLNRYFMGETESPLDVGEYYLLGCKCGEVGCWPLVGRIVVDADEVVWDQFRQPYRKNRDYSAFGPFRFDRRQYQVAVDELSSGFPEQSQE